MFGFRGPSLNRAIDLTIRFLNLQDSGFPSLFRRALLELSFKEHALGPPLSLLFHLLEL